MKDEIFNILEFNIAWQECNSMHITKVGVIWLN